MIHFILGNTGAGKTTYAQKLRDKHGAIIFSIDEWNNTLFIPDKSDNDGVDWFLERIARVDNMIKNLVVQLEGVGSDCVLDLGFAKQERRALAAAMPELKKGDIKKYEKAFKKWDEGEGMISSENLKDLLTLTLTGKLKWSDITDEQVEILLEKMGASKEIRTDNGGVVSITKSKFLDGMRSRKGIESGEIKLGNSNNRNSGDKDVQETLDLLDASSFGDDSWEMSQ